MLQAISLTIDANGTETINNALTYTAINAQYEGVAIVPTGNRMDRLESCTSHNTFTHSNENGIFDCQSHNFPEIKGQEE